MEEINAVTPQQIEALRKKFNEKVVAESPVFHPNDLERVKTDDLWMRRWIAHAESNIDSAVTFLYDCLQWRQEFGTNDLDESKIPANVLNQGTLFIHNQDNWEKKLLIFKAKTHTKGTLDIEILQKLVVYYFDRIERESNSDQISIIFDMKDTGWNNMDMDFVRYLITLLKTYYPYFVNYLIIFEMPWLLNAAWKIIKGWLPPKFVDRVKFQDKKTLKDYISVDNQLTEWGGTDNYVFKFEPSRKTDRAQNGVAATEHKRNKVQFTGNERMMKEVHQIDYSDAGNGRGTPVTPSPTPNQSYDNCLADVEDSIRFRPNGSDETYHASLVVKNIAQSGDALIIKIKTTSPERYRVKPIIFVLNRNARGTVNIETHQGVSAATMARDRFQVQVAIISSNQVPNSASDGSDSSAYQNDLGSSFRQVVSSGAAFETYKVSVSVEARPGDTGPGAGNSIALSDERLRKGLEELEKKISASVANQVSAKIAESKRMFFGGLAIIVTLFVFILIYLYKVNGNCDCSSACSGGTVSTGWKQSSCTDGYGTCSGL